MVVTLIVEQPDNYNKLNDIYLGEWLAEQLPEFISLPFDDIRFLVSVDVDLNLDMETIDIETSELPATIIE
jgi:hypothetical protein